MCENKKIACGALLSPKGARQMLVSRSKKSRLRRSVVSKQSFWIFQSGARPFHWVGHCPARDPCDLSHFSACHFPAQPARAAAKKGTLATYHFLMLGRKKAPFDLLRGPTVQNPTVLCQMPTLLSSNLDQAASAWLRKQTFGVAFLVVRGAFGVVWGRDELYL